MNIWTAPATWLEAEDQRLPDEGPVREDPLALPNPGGTMNGELSLFVLVATTPERRGALLTRAASSIRAQVRRPDRCVLVVDAHGCDLDPWRHEHPAFETIGNRRTAGAAGAWNSGLDHLARTTGNLRRAYVAILDDDDAWKPDHLINVARLLDNDDADVVAAPFYRIAEDGTRRVVTPPRELRSGDFLVGNPGIQGSNLTVRLETLLEAGLFDESFESCTDRDLCYRIATLPGIRYAVTREATVLHHACASRPRLSTPGCGAKHRGLDMFWSKYEPHLSSAQASVLASRAEAFFDWRPSEKVNSAVGVPAPSLTATSGSVALVVGVIVDRRRTSLVEGLLDDIRQLAEHPQVVGLDVVLLENTDQPEPNSEFERLVETHRRAGLSVYLIDRLQHAADAAAGRVLDGGVRAGGRLAIAQARTVLQSYLYAFLATRPGAVTWILDDDMRLRPLLVEDGVAARREPSFVDCILRARETGLDVAIGPYTGAGPLPFSATVRVQLVDLAASLSWLRRLPLHADMPNHTAGNMRLRAGRRDYYYDLSRVETDRLETPFLVTPETPGETVREALIRLSLKAERILAGEQVFRPLALDVAASGVQLGNGIERGGNCLVFDAQALRDVPNAVPDVEGRATRRSDMIWALLQRHVCQRNVGTVALPVFHDRSMSAVAAIDVQTLVDDIRGYALYSALKDTLPDQPWPIPRSRHAVVAERATKYLEERVASFRLSFYRIRGLARIIADLARSAGRALEHSTDAAVIGAWARLERFAARLSREYTLSVLRRVETEATALRPHTVRTFIDALAPELVEHQTRMGDVAALADQFRSQRIANAEAAVRLAHPDTGCLSVLGTGAEGVALTDGRLVYKTIDYSKARDAAAHRELLRSFVGAWANPCALYPLLGCATVGARTILTYPYEETSPYRGGHGPGLIELLAECRRLGVQCRNLHPDNLRVACGRVRLIDYGADVRLLENGPDFEIMCRRAYLCWRWWFREDLKELLRRSLTDRALPELEGFDRFMAAVASACEARASAYDLILDAARRSGARRVLDFGCGDGRLASALSTMANVTAFDIDTSRRSRWRSRANSNLRFISRRQDIFADAPYDLVVCSRVLCSVDDGDKFRSIVRDLRTLVADDGRVLLSVCHPEFVFAGATPECVRDLPSNARRHRVFVYEKRLRKTGRVRRDVHRPERLLQREFALAGLAIRHRMEDETVDLERFEPAAETLVLELAPLAPIPAVTLVIKASAMEAETLEVQVRHLVAQLERPRAFAERILVVDQRRDGFLRQHGVPDLEAVLSAADRLVETGWLDRVVLGPEEGVEAATVNKRWFGHAAPASHTDAGASVTPTLVAFDECSTRYLLQVDIDLMIGRLDPAHDYLAEMMATLEGDERAITVSLNIASGESRPYTSSSSAGPWRTEVRGCLLDLERLRGQLPLTNQVHGEHLTLGWHRALDVAVAEGRARSYRGGDHRSFFVHPPNAVKRDRDFWFAALDGLEHGRLPDSQRGHVEVAVPFEQWTTPTRFESFVFVIAGRNVGPGRFRRCLSSLLRQRRRDWGAVVIDDSSRSEIADSVERVCSDDPRITVVRNRIRRGLLANTVFAVRSLCGDPESVILTLDADDVLLGDEVLERVALAYDQGADATIGSMLRSDKHRAYPLDLRDPRAHRGGNVWQHLRTFRKRLFDALPDDALRLDGEYVDLANDWAYMLPIVELAENPVHIDDVLYLHEPSTSRAEVIASREHVISRLVAKPSLRRHG